ncbi:MAG TPA: hypothetical protein ENI48_06635, partial [Thioploca sp.]|nr:hypothetical protein [Thioploca sp.]
MQRFPIPNIYTQTFLWLDDRVQHHLAWRDDEYTQLVMLLLGKTRWRNSDKASLRLEITLSLLTGGRSSATVLKLAFVDDAKRTDTLIIRSHLTQADAETEKQNAKKLRVNTVDCFANLAEEEQFNLPNRYLVIYEDVAGNLVKEGETVAELSEALSRTLPSQSLDNITHFAKNFQEVIRQVTATYEEVNKKYDMVGGEQYYQQIRSQLPPDFVISQGVSVVEAISKDVVVQSQMPTESPQVISMTEFESQLAEEKYAAANWLQLQEQLWLEEKETVLTGDSQIAYLPFMAKEKNQTVRIWVGIAQDDVESIQPMLNINKGYQLTWLATERVTFTAQLENMGFDKQGCLSISAFQALTQKRYPHLQTDMRHNDLHCGNVLASGSSVKVIDVGDMERSLLAADIARLEVSIWFEVSKRLSQTLSKAKAETIIQNSYIGKAAASDSSQLVLLLSCILKSLREGFFEGVALKPQPFEIEAAYVTQILLYQRYCLLDGLKEIPPAFNVFACHWMNQAQRPLAELTPEYSEQRKASGPNPYLGLSAFQEEDAQRFFGREALTEKLWETFSNLLHPEPNRKPPPRLLPILGPSGSGKSSVARAGLVPALKHRLLPGLTGQRVEIITPTERPVENLARTLARIATQELSPVAKTLEFENLFKHHNDGLRRIVDALPDIDTAPLVILIDQFEETYTLCQEAKERTAFIDNLMVAVQDTTARLSVILTLRSDFLAETQRHEAFNQTIAEQSVIVPMMNKTELHRAISQPAEQAGCPLDAATVELLIKDTEEREGALPLLQFALLEIWEGMR